MTNITNKEERSKKKIAQQRNIIKALILAHNKMYKSSFDDLVKVLLGIFEEEDDDDMLSVIFAAYPEYEEELEEGYSI